MRSTVARDIRSPNDFRIPVILSPAEIIFLYSACMAISRGVIKINAGSIAFVAI